MKPNEIRNLAIIIIIGIIIIMGIIRFKESKTETSFEQTEATSEVEIEEVTFSEITKVYENGITTLTAKMMNNTNSAKNFKIKIVLKDDAGTEVQNMIQVVENLEPGRTKILSTGILGDYSQIKDVKFEVVK